VLEVPLFAGANSLDRVRDDLLAGDRILFLRNKGASARDAGLSGDAVDADADFYRLAAFDAQLLVDHGSVRSLADELPALDAIDGRSLADVIADLRDAGL
jgi:hypothetical protein